MTWIMHSNGKRAFHGTTVTGGKFAVAEGISATDLLRFAQQMEDSLEHKNNVGNPTLTCIRGNGGVDLVKSTDSS